MPVLIRSQDPAISYNAAEMFYSLFIAIVECKLKL